MPLHFPFSKPTKEAPTAPKRTLLTFEQYRKAVDALTTAIAQANKLPLLEKRGDGYELDHRASVKTCYDANVSVECCASGPNQQMLTEHKNRSKGSDNSLSVKDLRDAFNAIQEDVRTSYIEYVNGII